MSEGRKSRPEERLASWDGASRAAVGVALVIAVLATLGVGQLDFRPPEPFLPISGVWSARAEDDLASPRLTALRLDHAEKATQAQLLSSPGDASAWLRLAYIAMRRSPSERSAAIGALWKSYQAAPLNPDVALWRLRLAFELWDRLEAPLRQKVIAEVGAELGLTERRFQMAMLLHRIRNPAGRLAFGLALTVMKSGPLRR